MCSWVLGGGFGGAPDVKFALYTVAGMVVRVLRHVGMGNRRDVGGKGLMAFFSEVVKDGLEDFAVGDGVVVI